MTRATFDPAGGQSGFALLLVIWGLGIIALIASSLTVVERYRLQAAANRVSNGEAEALAEAAIALGRLSLAAEFQGRSDRRVPIAIGGAPTLCALPTGDTAAIAVEDEGGKVDLNAASPPLLQALLHGAGADRAEADRIAGAIVAFRQRPKSHGWPPRVPTRGSRQMRFRRTPPDPGRGYPHRGQCLPLSYNPEHPGSLTSRGSILLG